MLIVKMTLALTAALVSTGAFAASPPPGEIPTGHFRGVFERHQAGSKAEFEVDLIIRQEGERVFALQFETEVGKSASTWGLLLAVEQVDGGTLAFRKVFVDGTTPLPRVTDEPTLTGSFQYRTIRGGVQVLELAMDFPATQGYQPYQYVARRSANSLIWRDYHPSERYFGRASGPFDGELKSTPNYSSLTLTLRSNDDGVTVPCGIGTAKLEIIELFGGLYAARRVNVDLKQASGTILDQSLYGFVAPIGRANFAEGYKEMSFLTYQAESCSDELTPGKAAPTRVVRFNNKAFF